MLPSMAASLIVLLVVTPLTLLQRCGAADGDTTTAMYNLEYTTCSTSDNFTSNSPYQLNLAQLLAPLPSTAINNSGSFNGTSGSAPDTVFATAMCQADVPWPDQCNSCLQAATAGASSACPSSKNASVGYRGCVLRYSDTPMPAVADTGRAYLTQYHAARVSNSDSITFQQMRTELFAALSGAAAISPLKLAWSNRTFNSTNTMYGLAQCSRYLPEDECPKCIKALVTALPATALLSEGVSVTGFSCYIRYDLQAFRIYSPSANAEETPVQALHNLKGGSRHQAEIIAILVSISIIVLLGALMVARRYIRKRKNAELRGILGFNEFSYQEIRQATENFSENGKLGQGGFGQVYKGKLRIDNEAYQEIAVKRVTAPIAAKELLGELSLLARLVHRNVVPLVGFCSDDRWWSFFGMNGSQLYVCNKLMRKGSLDAHIFGEGEPLAWQQRYCIIRGICDGLQYLHEECNKIVAHMDLKPSNILLDDDMTPKIADFGLSRTFEKDRTQILTSRLIGSHGYMAPEYVNEGTVSRRCDIYSLGVIIIAIVMGKGPTQRADPCGKDFVNEVRRKFQAQDQEQLRQDAALKDGDCLEDVNKCIKVALKCVEIDPKDRLKVDDIVQCPHPPAAQ